MYQLAIGARDTQFCMKIYYELSYKFCNKFICKSLKTPAKPKVFHCRVIVVLEFPSSVFCRYRPKYWK